MSTFTPHLVKALVLSFSAKSTLTVTVRVNKEIIPFSVGAEDPHLPMVWGFTLK